MKIKIFLSILLIFFLTGCTPRLTYTILDGAISESIEIPFDNKNTSDEIKQKLEYYSYRDNLSTSVEVEETDTGYKGIITIPNMSMSAYFNNNSTLINECYEMVNFTEEDDKFYLNTSKGFNCMAYDYNFSDEIIITIETYNKVYQHNADEVKGRKYIWKITDENSDDQSILFIVGNKEYVWYYNYISLFIGLGVIAGIALILGIIILIFRNHFRRINKI